MGHCVALLLILILLHGLTPMIKGSSSGLEDNQIAYSSSSEEDDAYVQEDLFWDEGNEILKFNSAKKRTARTEIPMYDVVPSKGDIATIPPPNTTTPGETPFYPAFDPTTDSPVAYGFFDGPTFTVVALAIIYLFVLVGVCATLTVLLILCGFFVEKYGISFPRSVVAPVARFNVPPTQYHFREQPRRNSSYVRIDMIGAVAYKNLKEEV